MIRLYLKIPENFERLAFQNGFWVMHIPVVRIVKFNFLHNSRLITFPTPSCLVLYSFCATIIIIIKKKKKKKKKKEFYKYFF